jgi:hypothetical protein
MALVNILLKLEDVTHMRIPAGKVQPKDMDAARCAPHPGVSPVEVIQEGPDFTW